jgi:hypothetical protein
LEFCLIKQNRKNLTINKTQAIMKNMKKIFTLIAIFTVFAISTFAQSNGISATATSSATIITPISMSSDVPLAFGNVAVNANAGTVVMTPASPTVRTSTGGVTLPQTTGTYTAAHFIVGGQGNSAFTIGLPTDITITSSSNTMHVTTFLSSLTSNSGTLNSSGVSSFYVGATLNVNATQASGLYSGTFNVTVNYN